MQRLKIEMKGRTQESDEQLRHLEEQRTLEMLKLEIDIDKEDKLQPENSEDCYNR